MFTVALSGFQNGGRYAHGNLEATPLVEDGIMYVPDGWGSVYAIDVTAGRKGVIKWKMDPGTDRAWTGDVACCGINNRGVALWKDKVISIALDGRMFAINKQTGEVAWERKIADPAIGETLTIAPLIIRDLARWPRTPLELCFLPPGNPILWTTSVCLHCSRCDRSESSRGAGTPSDERLKILSNASLTASKHLRPIRTC